MFTYTHHAKYYETDQMGIIHHSNYIRWMEEARVALMSYIGCGYAEMEQGGVISPVVHVQCEFKHMVCFDDTVEIRVWIQKYNGVRLWLGYEMTNTKNNTVCAAGESGHCFLDKNKRVISLRNTYPQWDKAFRGFM